MKARFAGVLLQSCVLAFVVSTTAAQTSKAKPNKKAVADNSLSEAEYALLDEINQVRAHPDVYASYLEKLRPLFSGKQYTAAGHAPLTTEEGWAAVDEAIKFLRSATPTGPLSPSRGLSLAALAHVKDQSATGMTGHRGADSNFIEARVKPFGNWQGSIGENITYGNDSARERLFTWLIDDGVASRGHRKRLLSSDYKVAGVSCGPHPQFGAMCVLTLAGGFVDVPATVTTSKPAPATTSKSRNTTIRKM